MELLEAVAPEALEESGNFEIYADNSETLTVFLASSKQWRWIAGFGKAMPTGLDYAAVEAVMRMFCIKRKKRREIIEGIHIMEQAALEAING